jgi:hypothetical protein
MEAAAGQSGQEEIRRLIAPFNSATKFARRICAFRRSRRNVMCDATPCNEVRIMSGENQTAQADRLADDLLSGATEIADFLGTNTREVYYLVKTRRLPIGRLGRKLIASRSQLRRATRILTNLI